MARPGGRGYGTKPDDDGDGRRQKTLNVMITASRLLSIEAERLEFDVLFVPGGFLR